jgi:putative transposase
MRRIDELHMDYPFAGSRMLRDLLAGEGIVVGRLHVATLMKKMAIEAIYRRPNTSKPAPDHKVYPYLLRKLAMTRPNQVWATDITYIPMARGFVYLVAIVDWFSRRVLSWRLSITLEADFCIEALEEALSRFGKPEIFNTDSKNDGVGSFAAIWSHQATNCPRIAGTARCLSRSDPNTDRPGFVSCPGSVGG